MWRVNRCGNGEKLQGAGSDSHSVTDNFRCSIETEERIEKPTDYLEMMKAGKVRVTA